MIQVKTLGRPTKRSGYALAPGKTTKVGGLTITNTSSKTVHIDRRTEKPRKAKRK